MSCLEYIMQTVQTCLSFIHVHLNRYKIKNVYLNVLLEYLRMDRQFYNCHNRDYFASQ